MGPGANPIDAFIHARLQQEGLRPSPQADRRTLIQRLTYDLHGLIPTIMEVEAFVDDPSIDAYGRLVDRLLESPRYGERWARHWLDTVHFADSHGFEHDVFRPHAWRYRDYVIDRFNRDAPWDQFIREQLAADVFYPEASDRAVALGFLGAGPYDQSAAATAPMNFEYLDRDDLVTQTMGAFVSTTANCARCHSHKFDPISQADYFALQATFAGIGKGDIAFDADPVTGQQRRYWTQLLDAANQQRADELVTTENLERVSAWEVARRSVAWQPLDVELFVSTGGATLIKQADGSFLSTQTRPDKETMVVSARSSLKTITALRLAVLSDDSLPVKGPGRADNGNLHLSEFEVQRFEADATQGEVVAIEQATADFNQEGWTIEHSIDGNLQTAWGIHPREGESHHAVFALKTPIEMGPDTRLAITMKQVHGGAHIIGKLSLSATDASPEAAVAVSADAEAALSIPANQRTREHQASLAAIVIKHQATRELRNLPARSKVYAAGAIAENERGVIRFDQPREIRVLSRGDLEKPRQVVMPGALSAIDSLPARFDLPNPSREQERRAALADWLADPVNPLTWRSIANRVWHYHFGQGLCDTPNDFGRMGGLPSHPELLDWLACELRDNGGSLKHLHRLICNSETYQRSSTAHADVSKADPRNRLLARMSRQRLDADSFRDAMVMASGDLDRKMGGPGIAHFTTSPGPQATPVLHYDQYDLDNPEAGRRSIYRVVWRGIPDPLMEALDFPDLGLLAPKRGFSASPLQSLVLLNNRIVLHQSQRMAERLKRIKSTPADQIKQAVQTTWLRQPTDQELEAFIDLSKTHGLEAVCRLLFNSNEFLFVE
ncbi:MAG: DUF1549 and DUF1553 domain-containing protein [Pirellulaceae bacterium]